MRLFLSPDGLGVTPEALHGLSNYAREGVMVANALDHTEDGERLAAVDARREEFRGLGISTMEVDLRNPYARDQLGATTMRSEIYWVENGQTTGGTEDLRRKMAQTGMYGMLALLLERDDIVFAGSGLSGAAVATDLVSTARNIDGQISKQLLAAIERFKRQRSDQPLVIKDNRIIRPEAA
jgi:hypothetical protein